MSLMSEYGQDFSGDVKARGREYFGSGAVKITSHDETQVKATVDGTSRYRVMVGWDDADDMPVYSCTCPFFEDRGGEPCKHCWATVLKANADGVLPKPQDWDSGGGAGRAVVDDEDDQEDEEEDEYGGSPIVVGFGNPPYNPYKRPHGKPHVNKSDPGAWRKQLNALTNSMRSHPVHAPPPLAWPPGRRILYVVDRPGTMEGRGLVIELAHETPKKDGTLDRPKQLKIGREQIASLPDPVDRQIVQMLLGARRGDYGYYGYYDVETPRRFELPDSAYTTTLRLMCDTGRCRLRREQGEERPPAISWDDGPPWEFWLEVKPSPGGRYLTLDASLRRGTGGTNAANATGPEAPGNGEAVGRAAGNGEVPPNGQAATGASSETDPRDRSTGTPAGSTDRMELSEPDLLVQGGLVFARGRVARLEHFDAFTLIIALREGMKLTVPLDQREELLKTLFSLPRLPRLDLPDDLRVEELRPKAKPRLKVKKPSKSSYYSYDDRLVGTLSFDYDGQVVSDTDQQGAILTPGGRRVIHRDAAGEAAAIAKLYALGFRDGYGFGARDSGLRLAPSKLPKVVAELTREGWHIEADGKLYRQPGEFKLNVKSGIDWFELHGEVSFGDVSAPLPRLLEALRKGETSVRLDDGTFGLLPQEWLKKYAGLAGLGEQSEDHLRFNKRQVGFLDALLSSMPEARFDETFSRARDELMRFGGIESLDAPQTFQGALRAYQRDGLGWMAFLRKFGFGGCLADDMGLGKTVQVLALLEARRQLRQAGTSGDLQASDARPAESGNGNGNGNGNGKAAGSGIPHSPTPPLNQSITPPSGTSLVVAPRSLIFNWKQEATRFCPGLKVLDHTSVAREKAAGHFDQYDLVLTTYGTLRRDMAFLKDVRFDYAVLDEAQAIKNASSESAKAARLIQADHRLALSGTPVQNHLGELWSLFEFLNPGMMGAAGVFRDLTAGAAGSDPAARDVLARALRPFILRRTKEQVAKDLPEKLEQTVFCELEAEQRKLYNELRDHYRSSLLDRIAREGMNKAKIMVLEALLRLRQAACHPGLIDKKKSAGGSAKLDALMGHIADVLDEGHKVLVFSQFTSFLSIVRQQLDAAKTTYEYLDGKTKDRQGRVERFQNDPDCKLFLISLKAGGLGLNLTAAEYVFLLDPWWNPAVEAQAIDRAHRIGQTKRVFAYRLIAKDTVEEKVLQLQQSKKELADAIINADNSLIRSLKREDLEMLLS